MKVHMRDSVVNLAWTVDYPDRINNEVGSEIIRVNWLMT